MIAPPPVDPSTEAEVHAALLEHFAPVYGDSASSYVASLLDLGGAVDRFSYLRTVAPDLFGTGSDVLISGFSVGSEMLVARQFGFGVVYGVEVDPFLVTTARRRLAAIPDMYPDGYDGEILPHGDGRFALVTSGHVIEHTASPERYLRECFRVLVPNGCMALEFPTRYHHRELHTGLPSFEWLPRGARNICLRVVSSRHSPLPLRVRTLYASILGTGLRQVSPRGVRVMLARAGIAHATVDLARPAPGIVRYVIRKLSSRTKERDPHAR